MCGFFKCHFWHILTTDLKEFMTGPCFDLKTIIEKLSPTFFYFILLTKFEREHMEISLSVGRSVGWFVCLSMCPSVLSNLVTRTTCTSTFLPRMTWNFAYAFVMRCRCAWHNFQTRHSRSYCPIFDFKKIVWRDLFLHFFPEWHEHLLLHL